MQVKQRPMPEETLLTSTLIAAAQPRSHRQG